MVVRKMLRNKWLMISLLMGFVFFIALMVSIPLYTNGILQNMLIKELEKYQLERNIFPGNVVVTSDYGYYKGGSEVHQKLYKTVSNYLNNTFLANVSIPVRQKVEYHETKPWTIKEDFRQRKIPRRSTPTFKFAFMTDLDEHIEIIDGTMPSPSNADGTYEVLVTEDASFRYNLAVGDEFILENNSYKDLGQVRMKVAGIFTPKTDDPLYWFDNITSYNRSMFLNEEVFYKDFFEKFYIDKTIWYMGMDYHSIDIDNLTSVYTAFNNLEDSMRKRGFTSVIPAKDLLPKYDQHREKLIPLLLSLYAPVIIMLLFYLFMVSSLVVDRQKNEIAIFVSRGAGRLQIIFGYLLEAIILGIISMVLGPLLGVLLCRVLGSTTNFMEFVNRTALDIEMNEQTFQFALVGLGLSIIAMILPVCMATGTNILMHKRNIGSSKRTYFWKRYFLDFVLLAISFYGLYQFNQRQKDLLVTNVETLHIDPLLFVISAAFTLGLGLVFIRLFPYLIEGLYRLGRRYWPITIYTSLIEVARSAHSYQFLILFMVMTIGTGLFSATAARTINQNAQDKIRYAYGADHILMERWQTDEISAGPPSSPGGAPQENQPSSTAKYAEPNYEKFKDLKGVASTAKVYRGVGRVYTKGGKNTVLLFGIEPKEFGETAWFPDNLLPYHWYHYLNQLSWGPNMALISKSLAEKEGFKLWDRFTMNWDPNGMAEFMVAGIIDYWPTWNPNVKFDEKKGQYDMLVVTNLRYLYDNAMLQPYEVWLKMEPDASTQELYEDIKAKKIRIIEMTDMKQALAEQSKDPFQLGINGALTLVFLISILISLSGFMIFWILAIYSRMFRAGIMMAMGVRLRELMMMVTWEQILTSVLPMLFGIVTGGLASRLFVPLLQMSFSAAEQVPPFKVIALASDYIRIYIILGVMLVLGLASIMYMLSKLEIYSCIKLGEDR